MRSIKAILKGTLAFFAWLFRAVFRWTLIEFVS